MKKTDFFITGILVTIATLIIFAFVFSDVILGVVSWAGLARIDDYQNLSVVLSVLCIPGFIFLIFALCYISNKMAHQIHDLELQLAETTEKMQSAIDKMKEDKLAMEQLTREKDAAVANIEKIHASMKDTGLCGEVIRLLSEGKTKEEIAELLVSPEYGSCSQPQIGALLNPNVKTKAENKVKYAQRLLGIAKN